MDIGSLIGVGAVAAVVFGVLVAWRARRSIMQHFDLVICDIFMPDKEGIETLRELRGLDPAVPVIMMSDGAPSVYLWGTMHRDFLGIAERFGATRTIEKPFKYSQLLRLVKECLAAGLLATGKGAGGGEKVH